MTSHKKGILDNKLQWKCFVINGYHETMHTPGLWKKTLPNLLHTHHHQLENTTCTQSWSVSFTNYHMESLHCIIKVDQKRWIYCGNLNWDDHSHLIELAIQNQLYNSLSDTTTQSQHNPCIADRNQHQVSLVPQHKRQYPLMIVPISTTKKWSESSK